MLSKNVKSYKCAPVHYRYILMYIAITYFLFLQRNYRFFYMFILTATMLCLYVHIFSWISLVHQRRGILKAMTHDILSVFLIVYCFIAIWFVGGLTVFHFYLISTNQVTSTCNSTFDSFLYLQWLWKWSCILNVSYSDYILFSFNLYKHFSILDLCVVKIKLRKR